MNDICEECNPNEKPLCVEECQEVCPMVDKIGYSGKKLVTLLIGGDD